MEATKQIPWRKPILVLGTIVGILLATCLGLEIAYAADFDSTRRSAYLHVSSIIWNALSEVFHFFQPFVQVALVLLFLGWALHRFYPKFDVQQLEWQKLNVDKLVIVLIIGGFVVLSIRGGLDSLTYSRDLAMVGLGFYFGGLRRPNKNQTL